MNFLRPEFLFALPLAAIPILIHLLNRQRFQRIDFSAMEFLRRAIRRTRRRLLIEDILLLILRTLAVLFLILALARPGADPGSLLVGRAARAEILILDSSMSMNHRDQGTSSFERGVQFGLDILKELDPERGDRAALIKAGSISERLAYGSPDEVRSALSEQDQAGNGLGAIAPALQMAARTADSLSLEGPEEVRITVLTDLQATNWDLENTEGEALRSLVRKGFLLAIADVSAERRNNTAVLSLDVQPQELAPGEYGEVHARLRNFGDQPREGVGVTLLLDGIPVTRTRIDLAANEELDWSFPLAPAEVGPRAIAVELESDSLISDDQRATILPVRPAPRVTLAGDPAAPNEPEGVFDTLRRFLDLGEGAPVRMESRPPNRLATDLLGRTDVLVLADPAPLGNSALNEITAFLARGGGLLIALGPQTGAREIQPLLDAIQIKGIRLGEEGGNSEGTTRIAIKDSSYPALRLFQDPRWQPLLTEVPFESYRQIQLELAGDAEAGRFKVPLRFVSTNPDQAGLDYGPALLEWTAPSSARVVFLAATPLPLWNRMAQVPGGSLPFLLDLIAHLVPRPGHELVVQVGSKLAVQLPRPPTEVTLSNPIGASLHPSAPAEITEGGRAYQPLVEAALLPGVWSIDARMLDSTGEEEVLTEKIAVVTPPRESDLTTVSPTGLETWLPEGTEILIPGEDSDRPDLESQNSRPQDLSGLFFRLVILMLIAETALAAFLDRRRG